VSAANAPALQQVECPAGDTELIDRFELLPGLFAVVGALEYPAVLLDQLHRLFGRLMQQVDVTPVCGVRVSAG
jgi:hypothetical protein